MTLAPDIRRRDKDKLLPEKIPKFYISGDMVSKVSKRFPNVKVRRYKSKFYVVLEISNLFLGSDLREKSLQDRCLLLLF